MQQRVDHEACSRIDLVTAPMGVWVQEMERSARPKRCESGGVVIRSAIVPPTVDVTEEPPRGERSGRSRRAVRGALVAGAVAVALVSIVLGAVRDDDRSNEPPTPDVADAGTPTAEASTPTAAAVVSTTTPAIEPQTWSTATEPAEGGDASERTPPSAASTTTAQMATEPTTGVTAPPEPLPEPTAAAAPSTTAEPAAEWVLDGQDVVRPSGATRFVATAVDAGVVARSNVGWVVAIVEADDRTVHFAILHGGAFEGAGCTGVGAPVIDVGATVQVSFPIGFCAPIAEAEVIQGIAALRAVTVTLDEPLGGRSLVSPIAATDPGTGAPGGLVVHA
jgi:hypothetical protein